MYIASGFLVGTIVGMTGVGGGSLMTPILIFFFGVKPHLAIGTDLLFAAFTKMGGTWTLARRGLVPWGIVWRLSAGSLPAAGITLLVLHHVGPATEAAQRVMTLALGVALLLTAAATLFKVLRTRSSPVPAQAWGLHPNNTGHAVGTAGTAVPAATPHPWQVPLFGAVIGTLVTLTSVGAGAIGVSVLLLLYPLLPLPRIVAADIAYAVPLTLLAGLGHASLGSVNWPLLALLLTGSLPGIWLGSRLAQRAPERAVRSLLSVLLAYAGVKLIAI